jgi:UDP-glucose 4-epimerase
MRVLVSGAAGFLGRHVVDRLLMGGHTVRAIVRPESYRPNWKGDVEIFVADLRVHDNLVTAFKDIDATIHLAAATTGDEDVQFASTVVATERFLDAMAQSSTRRLIHVSSFVVYDWSRINWVLDEDSPILTDNFYDMGGYTIAKMWQERVVSRFAKTHAWDLTILRPGFIWGQDHEDIAGMGRRIGRVHVMFGPFTRLPLCHVVNCADCVVSAVEKPSAIGETFNVIDGDDIRVWQYARMYSRRTGRSAIMLPIPYWLGLALAHVGSSTSRVLFGKRGKLPSLLVPRRFQAQFKPLRFSNQKARNVLQWKSIRSFEECSDLSFGQRRQEKYS